MSKFGYINAEIDATAAVLDNEDEIVVPVTLTREAVLQYPRGKVLRPAIELQKSAFTFEGAFITESKHPVATRPSGTPIDLLVTNPKQIVGRVTDIKFDADAVDPKGRKSAKVSGLAHIWKKRASTTFVKRLAAGAVREVSVGIIRDEEFEPGVWNGEPYQYVHKNIVGNHLAVGVARARCPYVGVGVDSMGSNIDQMTIPELEAKIKELQDKLAELRKQLDAAYATESEEMSKVETKVQEQVAEERQAIVEKTAETTEPIHQELDQVAYELSAFQEAKVQKEIQEGPPAEPATSTDEWDETDEYIRSGHRSPDEFDPDSLRTIDIDAEAGIKAISGCPSGNYDKEAGECKVGTEIQSYLFDKSKDWTMEKAKQWFQEHEEGASTDAVLEIEFTPPGKPTSEIIDKYHKNVR